MTAEATVHLTRGTLAVTGITVPPAVSDALDRYDQVKDRIRHLHNNEPAAAPSALSRAVLAALDAGQDPLTSKTVARALTYRDIAGSLTQVAALAANDVVEAVQHNAAAIVAALKAEGGPFDRAKEQLERAHNVIGTIPLDDTQSLIARGPDHAAAWADAHNGLKTMRNLAELWDRVHAGLHGTHNARGKALIVARPADGDYSAFPRAGAHAQRAFEIWDALNAGWELDLADGPDDLQSRVSSVEAHYQRIDNEKNTRHRGPGIRIYGNNGPISLR